MVILILGGLFYYLAAYLESENIPNKVKNVGLQSAITRMVVSTDGYIAGYGKTPDEAAYLAGLSSDNIEFKDSCTIRTFAKYECLFKPETKPLPQTCDSSHWRSDKIDYQQCFFRYYGGAALRSNYNRENSNYRIYVKAFGSGDTHYVYDSSTSGVLYSCPSTINDFDTLEDCNAL